MNAKDLIEKLQPDYWLKQVTSSNSNFEPFNLLNPSSSTLILVSILITLISVLFLVRVYLRYKRSIEEVGVLLELTPPVVTEKTAYTTQQLFSVIHGLGEHRTLWDKLLGKKVCFSFEIASTQNQGIRYLIRTTPNLVNNIKRNLLAYMPQVSIKTVNEYLPKEDEVLKNYHRKTVEYKLTKSFGFPLQKQDILKEHDPVAYITGQMTKLSPGELISLQIVLSPTKTNEVQVIASHIRNGTVLEYLNKPHYPLPLKIVFGLLMVVINLVKSILDGALSFFQEAGADPESLRRMRAFEMQSKLRMNNPIHPKEFSPYEQEIIQSIKEKIEQPLFDAVVRLFVIARDKKELKERITGVNSSLQTFAVPSYQQIRVKRSVFDLI